MIIDCLWELQKAIFVALSGDGELSGLVSGVYSHVPQDATFPYVKIDSISAGDSSTLASRGIRGAISVLVLSRERGSKEALNIITEIKRILDRSSLSMTGCSMVSINYENSAVRQLNDGITWVGSISFDVFVVED